MKDGAVIYCRVSTEDQVENNSLPVQQRDCREKAERLGCEVLDVFVEEGVSGTRQDRPAMARMLTFCAANRDRVRYVIVKDIDRFSRDVLVYHTLRSQFRSLGITLYSVHQPNIAEGTAESRLLEAMFSGISQYERDKILQRTLSGTKEVIAKGGWTNYAPLGYRSQRTSANLPSLAVVPEEAAGVRKAFELFAEGLTLLRVTSRLEELGYRTKRGRPISLQTVHRMLRNPVYVGKVQSRFFPERLLDGVHPPVIPNDLWLRAQARIAGRRTVPVRHKANPDFILTNVLRCGECGSPMTGSRSTNRLGNRYAYYHCRKTGCRSRNFPKALIEGNFVKLLRRVRPTDTWMRHFEEVALQEWRQRWHREIEDGERLSRRLKELEAKRNRVEDTYFDGRIDEDTYRRNLRRVEQEIVDVGLAREQSTVSEEALRSMLRFSRQFFTSLSNTWENGLPEQKRLIQKVVFPEGLTCERDGAYRTPRLPPTLAIFASSKVSVSHLVTLVRTSWNTLLTSLMEIADLQQILDANRKSDDTGGATPLEESRAGPSG